MTIQKIQHHKITLIVLLVLCTVSQALAGDFLLFYSNDVHGETTPCG